MSSRFPPWSAPPSKVVATSGDVHVWRASLDWEACSVQELTRVLSDDELARASRFHFRRDRDRFVVRRGLLRTLLGLYLDAVPAQILFGYNRYGKPSVVAEVGPEALCFNLSHSNGLALFAFSRGRELGVDIEYVRRGLAVVRIAERFFSPREVAELRALPSHVQLEAFFSCWTRKEAYIKARGMGLSLPLDRFAVSLASGHPAALLSNEEDPAEVSRWALQELAPGPGFVAALAVEGQDHRMECWQWPGCSSGMR